MEFGGVRLSDGSACDHGLAEEVSGRSTQSVFGQISQRQGEGGEMELSSDRWPSRREISRSERTTLEVWEAASNHRLLSEHPKD